MKILFCTDGSQCSFTAFKNASAFIKKAEVDIICVIDWNFLPESMNIEENKYSGNYEYISDSILNYAEKHIEENNIIIGKKIKLIGSASDVIIETLYKSEYDLVVMGSQGKKGISKWLGSVSKHVAENSNTPCFISKGETKNKKVLFATDGSKTSFNAAIKFVNNFESKDKEITILYVKEEPDFFPTEAAFDRNWLEAIEKQQKILAAQAIYKLKKLLEEYNAEITNEVILTGNPAQEIINYCNCEGTDIVVMGTRSKSRFSKILLGSVSNRVLDNVASNVLIINDNKNNIYENTVDIPPIF